MSALLDTSVLIALERGDLDPPDTDVPVAISVITLAELRVGLLRADTEAQRSARMESLVGIEQSYAALGVDTFVARQYAQLVAEGLVRGQAPPILDGLIAATAMVHGLTLITRDRGFEQFEGLTIQLL